MPAVHGITLTSNPAAVATTPGGAANTTLTLTAVGNVADTVTLTAVGSGLTAGGLPAGTITLNPGQSVTVPVSLTAAPSTPLNSTLQATFTATFGPAASPLTQTVQVPVRVVVPGADAIAGASAAAGQLGDTDLSNRLTDLSAAVTNLFQNPGDPVYLGQALAALAALIGVLGADPYLAPLVPALTADRGQLAAATTAGAVGTAVTAFGNDLVTLNTTLADEVGHRFTFALAPNTAVAQPNSPATFDLDVTNTGTQATTYDFAVSGLPAGVTASFNTTSVTLNPGDQTGGTNRIYLTLTETGTALAPVAFTVTATPRTAAELALSQPGALTVRPDLVSVAEVDAAPAFASPGDGVAVSAKVLNAVNRPQQAEVSYTVTTSGGNTVFTSAAVPLALGLQTTLATVALPALDTTGFAPGSYTITVTVADGSGNPLPGGTGTGTLLVGSPVTASLTTTPAVLPPGDGTVTTTLAVHVAGAQSDLLTLDGQTATTQTSTTIALDGTLAYVAGTNGIDVVDVSNPAAPTVKNTFGGDLIVHGGFTVVRRLGSDDLIVGTTTNLNANGFNVLVYSLADPVHPALVSNTAFGYAFLTDLEVSGTTALVTTNGFTFSGNTINNQFGDVITLDVSDPAHPAIVKVQENTAQPFSGTTNKDDAVFVTPTTAYVSGTTSTGGNTNTGTGQVLVVDTSAPANTAVVRRVTIPGTVRVESVGIQGDRALVVGSTGGWRNPFTIGTDTGLTGNLTLTVLDVSDPLDPKVLGTTLVTAGTFPTQSQTGGVSKLSVLPVGNGLFAVSETELNNSPVMLVVDANDPGHIVAEPHAVPALVNEMAVAGGVLYTTSSAGLLTYTINQAAGTPVTVSATVPTADGVGVVPGSFSDPPDQVTTGANTETFAWTRYLGYGTADLAFTWQSAVTGLQPDEARAVTTGAAVGFTGGGTAGSVPLPGTTVVADRIIALTPVSQTVAPGEAAAFTVTLTNPTAAAAAYTLSVQGVPAGWVNLPASVTVPANGSTTVPLQLTPDSFAPTTDYGFTVTATTTAGATGAADGTLTVSGTPTRPDPNAHGVVLALTPSTATLGPGSSTAVTVQLTNTGSAGETYALTVTGLPAGVTAAFEQNGTPVTSVDLPPGASNFRDVTLVLTAAVGTAAGTTLFTVTSTSTTSTATGSAAGSVTVAAAGVTLGLNTTTGNPGTTFQATVTNTGSATDTFTLAAAGPAGLTAALNTPTVTLAPGASQTVPVTTRSASFAAQGTLGLTVMAQSRANPAVRASASAGLVIPATTGLAAGITPGPTTLPAPGPAPFTIQVNDTGNTEDAYTATITGTTGPVTATLLGLDGNPTQTIPTFRIPGLSSGDLTLNTDLTGAGQGTVTVRITSLNDPSRTVTATATVGTPPPPAPPPPPPAVTLRLATSQSVPTDGQPVTLTATVPTLPGLGTPTGTVTFTDGAITLGSADLVNGTATITTTALPVGSSTVTASYSGGPGYAATASPPVPEDVQAIREGKGQIYVIGAGPGGGPRVEVFDAATNTERFNFFAYASSQRGGVSVATGDVLGTGTEDVITGPGVGGGPEVEVFDGKTGALIASWFAYPSTFRGGVWVAAEDLDGGGQSEIVTGPGPGGGPAVEVWKLENGTPTLVRTFLAFDTGFRGGVTVAAGLTPGGSPTIVVGAGPGGGPRVRTFDAATLAVLSDVFVYEPSFTGGVYVASGDVLGTGTGTQVLVGPGPGGGPRLVVLGTDGPIQANVFAAVNGLRNGLTVAAVDRAGGAAAVLVGAGQGASEGTVSGDSLANLEPVGFFEAGFTGGVFVG